MSLSLRQDESALGPGGHLGELRLRRLRVGELAPREAAAANEHLEGCGDCRLRLERLAASERAFAQAISYPRFAGGVERAARVPRQPRAAGRRVWLSAVALGCAAAAGLMLVFRPTGEPQDGAAGFVASENRSKGGAAVELSVRIASADGRAQRSVLPGSTTHLAPGERLRIGYQVPATRYLFAVAVDDAGVISLLFDEGGDSHLVGATKAMTYLPDSIELTGAGHERVFLFVSHVPFPGGAAQAAIREARRKAGGDLTAMEVPRISGDVTGVSWLFRKP
ncbi:MAG TPA: hypothetical protein VGF45_11415 [Polyangia bacterium]